MEFALFEASQVLRVVQVALGIGLVIFVHELGHFLAARWCGVRVEMFSLGFGPRIFGWKRGATTYQLALIPMGGFVKMAGEEGAAAGAPLPDELPAKSVGQRFFIYSGGVLMNVLFALVVFPPLLFHGVPFPEPVVGLVAPGGPAWSAGLEPGTRILEIDGERVVSFDDVQSEIGLSDEDAVSMLVQAPGAAEPSRVIVRPVYSESAGIKLIGVDRPNDARLTVDVEPGSAAAAAGLKTGDRVVAVDGSTERMVERVVLRMGRAEPLALEVERGGAPAGDDGAPGSSSGAPERLRIEIAPRLPEAQGGKRPAKLGVVPAESRVGALRPEGAASPLGLLAGDRILFLDGLPVGGRGDFEIGAPALAGRPFEIVVERGGERRTLAVPALDAATLARAVRDTAVVSDPEDTRISAPATSAAAQAGMRTGDRIVRIADRPVRVWKDVFESIGSEAKAGKPLAIKVVRLAPDGTSSEHELSPVPAAFNFPEHGFTFAGATYVYRAASFGEAVGTGVKRTWMILADAWEMLRGIFRGSVSSENLGGIIAISHVSYMFAGVGFAKLVFFLCMLSLSLAFINVLPIPVLDGGHLFFLLIEKLKGSPVNERVLGYSQMVGLVLILGLVVFVTFNDLRRILE